MRTKGSCRFAPYYKVELWHQKLCCWSPIQKAFASKEEAIAKGERSKIKYRVMRCTEEGVELL